MFEKIKNYQDHPRVQQLRDVRVLGLVVFAVLALLVSWSGVKVIQSNYALQRQITKLQQQNEVLQLTNNNLKLKNQYLNTSEYLELSARRQFGKAASGEKLILVPKQVALAHTTTPAQPSKKTVKTQVHKPTYQRNFEAWMNFFLHRPTVE
jgi:cell division protein FtsB